jgi:phosphate starvation-inducible membrane PsiE
VTQIKARSLLVAVIIVVVIIAVFLAVAFVFLFLVWPFSNEDISSYRAIEWVWVAAVWMYAAHAQW